MNSFFYSISRIWMKILPLVTGIQFIMSNFASVTDEKQQTPVGFDIIFPGMIECAQDLNLNLPLRSSDINAMLERRHLELNRLIIFEGFFGCNLFFFSFYDFTKPTATMMESNFMISTPKIEQALC